MRRFILIFCWLAQLVLLARANNDTQPISIFRSRPDLVAPVLTIIQQDKSKQASGYYFVAPYQQLQESVHIYDNDAHLIWTGFGAIGPGICHAPQVCQYNGEPHLCFYQGTQMIGWGHGHGIILDKHYRIVKSIEPPSYQASSDMHEFMVIENGKSALMTQYLRSVYDMCPWGLCEGLGYIQQGVFHEVDVSTGKSNFEWRSLDHVDPSESFVLPSTTEISGTAQSPESPWDYFHINSIDKNKDGDYLVSARHTSCIYKISGKDGHIIWRLNGVKSDYVLDGFDFSFQHDARWVEDNEDESIISVFDNGSNGFTLTQSWSTGQMIRLNHKTKNATAILNLAPPLVDGRGHLSKSQGNFQRLPGGNVVMGWGSDAFWTEYAPAGANVNASHEIAFYGTLGYENVMNYRVHKFDGWVGMPLTKPALWTYSKYAGSTIGGFGNISAEVNVNEMYFYVSWNGATEVTHWVFYSAQERNARNYRKLETVQKSGFETAYKHVYATYAFGYVEALDKHGKVLGTSEVQALFVPNQGMRDEWCDDLACQFMVTKEEKERIKAEAEAKERERLEEEEKLKAEEALQLLEDEEEAENNKRHKAAMDAKVILGSCLGVGLVVVMMLGLLGARGFGGGRPTVNVLAAKVLKVVRRSWESERKVGGYKTLAMDEYDGEGAVVSRELEDDPRRRSIER